MGLAHLVLLGALVCLARADYDSAYPRNPLRSDLEKAMTSAFAERIEDGTFAALFGTNAGFQGDMCAAPSEIYQYPNLTETMANPNSTLRAAIDRGKFICGFTPDLMLYDEAGNLLLDTTEEGNPKGSLVTFYHYLGLSVSAHYGVPFNVVWRTPEGANANDILNSVRTHDYDAACGRWATGATMKVATGTFRRVDVLSLQTCITWIVPIQIYKRVVYPPFFDSFGLTVEAIDADPDYMLCAPGSPGGGTEQACTETMRQYTVDKSFQCHGTADMTWDMLDSGACDAVWSGPPPVSAYSFYSISSPAVQEYGSFYAPDKFDISSSSILSISSLILLFAVMFNFLLQ